MSKKLTREDAIAYLADDSNFWSNDELCYTCGNEYDSLASEFQGKIFCREKCCKAYMKIVAAAKERT